MDKLSIPKPYEGSENFIFISYSHQDTDKVLPIIGCLMNDGYRVWYDDGISPGTEWPEVIAQHLNNCELFIAFISAPYTDSFNCKREIDFAVRKRKKFLAVFLEETVLPLGMEMQISTVQSVNYYQTTQELFLDRLYNSEVMRDSGCKVEPVAAPAAEVQAEAEPKPPITQLASQPAPEPQETARETVRNIPRETAQDTAGRTEQKADGKETQKKPGKRKKALIIIPIVAGVLGAAAIFIAIIVGVFLSSMNSGNDNRTIQFSDVVVTDDVLLKAARRKNIRTVELENCELSITDKTVWDNILSDEVAVIRITGCGLTNEDAGTIVKNAPYIVNLELSNNKITDASFMSSCPNIYTLDLSGNQIEDASFLDNEKLQRVNLSNNKIAKINNYNLENISELRLDGNQLEDLNFLETAIHLQTLSVCNNQLKSIDGLKNSTILTNVYLAGNDIEDVTTLKASKDSIRQLDLSGNEIKSISEICPLPSLNRINLNDNALDSLVLDGSADLSYITARNNKIDTISGNFDELTYLDIANNKLSGEIDLSNCSKLKKAFLENNYISSVKLFPSAYNYGDFSLYNNPITALDYGNGTTSYSLYMSYSDKLNKMMGEKFCSTLYLQNCPLDIRVSFENVWGTYSLKYPEKNEMVELVEELRKDF